MADQLGIGTRHLRRWQSTAQEALADTLWLQFDLAARFGHEPEISPAAAPGSELDALHRELAWLKETSANSASDPAEILPAVIDLAGKLAARYDVSLDITQAAHLPRIGVGPVALRQTLINLFSVVIPRAAGGQVTLTVEQHDWNVQIHLRSPQYVPALGVPADGEADNLNLAHHLAELCGYGLDLNAGPEGFDATLTFAALEQIPVLAIDDSADALQLMGRYAAGTRYRLVGTRDPAHSLELASRLSPKSSSWMS